MFLSMNKSHNVNFNSDEDQTIDPIRVLIWCFKDGGDEGSDYI